MAGIAAFPHMFVTPEKVEQVVGRIVEHANPLQIIVFGSRARGNHRPESDLDLAIILDGNEEGVYREVPYTLFDDIPMEVDLIVVSKGQYDYHRPWRNSIYNYIDTEGVVIYDRVNPQRGSTKAMYTGAGRCLGATASAA